MLVFLPDSACRPVHCVCWRLEVWGMFGRCWKEKMCRFTYESGGWCSVPWALWHRCCQTPGLALLPSEPTDQTFSTGLSKAISSRGEQQTERRCDSSPSGKGDKKALCFDVKDQSVHSGFFCVFLAPQSVYECVLLTDHTRGALSEGGSLQNNIFRVPTCSQRFGERYLLYNSLKSKSKNVKPWRQNMNTMYSNTGNRKEHGLGHRAVSQKD